MNSSSNQGFAKFDLERRSDLKDLKTQQAATGTLQSTKRGGGSSRNFSHNYGMEKSTLAENKNHSNLTYVPQPNKAPYQEQNLKKNESRCSWNKFTYGANPVNSENALQTEGTKRGHTYGACPQLSQNDSAKEQQATTRQSYRPQHDQSDKTRPLINGNGQTGTGQVPDRFGERRVTENPVLQPIREAQIQKPHEVQNRCDPSAQKLDHEKNVNFSTTKEKTEETNSALERSKLRLAQLKANPKPATKGEEGTQSRDTRFIWRKSTEPEHVATASYLPTSRNEKPREQSKKHIIELEKKYNPVATN